MSKCKPQSREDLEKLRECFYTSEGKLYAKKAYCRRVTKGQKVGTKSPDGYFRVGCNYKTYLVHRVIYYLHYGVWPLGVVDHIDGNPSNNNPDNLRDLSQAENTRSYGPAHKDSTSRYRGVHRFKRDQNWQAQIMCDGKRKHLGYFDSEKEATLVWNYSALELGFNKEALNMVFEDYPKVNLEDLV